MKVKEPVKLRQRKLANGNISLYLDVYRDGARNYEFLKLYLIPETTKADKVLNKQTLELANAIKAQRIVEVQQGAYGFKAAARNVKFFDYAEEVMNNGDKRASTKGIWRSTIAHLHAYEPRDINLADIDKQWVEGFVQYLSGAPKYSVSSTGVPRPQRAHGHCIAQGTQWALYARLRSILNAAVADGLISSNPATGIVIKKAESIRQYLTIDELKVLADTECPYEILKRAFLFSCFTGLRWSDVTAIKWADVEQLSTGTRILFSQMKTGNVEYLDISEQAATLMGERQAPDAPVFGLFLSKTHVGLLLKTWALRAGINKHITFHSARHTFAVMMLDLGVDLYTTSKLLGHRNISTTQIYAKILDKNKQAAVAKIPKIL